MPRVLLFVADLVFSKPNAAAPSVRPAQARNAELDPAVEAEVKAQRVKRASGPHLRTTVRVAVTGARGARRIARNIADGFDLAATATTLRVHPARRARVSVPQRRHGRGFIATLAELAALWHLPPEPRNYGIHTESARNRPPEADLPRPEPFTEDGPDTDDEEGDTRDGYAA